MGLPTCKVCGQSAAGKTEGICDRCGESLLKVGEPKLFKQGRKIYVVQEARMVGRSGRPRAGEWVKCKRAECEVVKYRGPWQLKNLAGYCGSRCYRLDKMEGKI